MKICHKWLPPSTKGNNPRSGEHKNQKKRVSRVIPDQFRFYVDTKQALRCINEISPDDVGSISSKIHGCSYICSKSLVLRKLSIRDKIARFLGVKVQDKEYDYLYASRSVIKNDSEGTGFYKVDIWTDLGKKYFEGKLHDGESVYGEVVGYLPNSTSMIQGGYDYGELPGSYGVYVYRITQTTPDGAVVSLDWNAMKARCAEIQVKMVKEYFYGRLKDKYPEIPVDENWHKNFVEALQKEYLEKDVVGNLCKKVPDEGVVLRVEGLGIRVYKLKSLKFLNHESVAREEEVIDIEDQESVSSE